MKLLFALLIAMAALVPIKARAGSEYMLYFITYNPYSKTPVAGPFATIADCNAAKGSSYSPNGVYTCQVVYTPN